VDNNSNWEDAPITNLITNRPNSSTCSWSKSCYSDNTNEQVADILSCITNTLTTNQTSSPNSNLKGTKAHIPNTFNSTKPNKLNNFLLQYHFYFHANSIQFNTDIAKINFVVIIYLTRVAQDWFEVGLN